MSNVLGGIGLDGLDSPIRKHTYLDLDGMNLNMLLEFE